MGVILSRFLVSHSGGLPARRTLTMTPRLRRPVPSTFPAAAPLSSRRSLFSTKATPRPLQTVPRDLECYFVLIATAGEEEDVFFSAVDTDDVLYILLNMPGVSRDGLEVRFEPTTDKLVVIGKRVPDPNIAEIEVGYIVPTRFFCTERIEYTMKSGMLVLSIPKKVTGEVVSNDGFDFIINNAA